MSERSRRDGRAGSICDEQRSRQTLEALCMCVCGNSTNSLADN